MPKFFGTVTAAKLSALRELFLNFFLNVALVTRRLPVSSAAPTHDTPPRICFRVSRLYVFNLTLLFWEPSFTNEASCRHCNSPSIVWFLSLHRQRQRQRLSDIVRVFDWFFQAQLYYTRAVVIICEFSSSVNHMTSVVIGYPIPFWIHTWIFT